MQSVSLNEKFELYLNTLNSCGKFLLNCSDEDIEYYIFEEFDSDSISFLHEQTLKPLLEKNFITKKIYDMSRELATKFRELERTDLWNVKAVKTHKKWFYLLNLSDEIKSLISEL